MMRWQQYVMHRVQFVVRQRFDLQPLATNNSGDSGSGNRPSRYLTVISHTERALRYTAFASRRRKS